MSHYRARARVAASAVLLLYGWRSLSSVLIALPLLLAVKASGAVSGPTGDAVLFAPGAWLPLESFRQGGPYLASALMLSLLLLVLCGVLGAIPLAAAISTLSEATHSSLAARLARGCRFMPGFLVLSGITLLAQAALFLGASILGSVLASALRGGDERWTTLVPLIALGLGLLGACFCGAIQDVARVILLRKERGARDALLDVMERVREHWSPIALGCYPSIAGSAFAAALAALLVVRENLTLPSLGRVALVVLAHQLAVLVSVALRVRWLEGARALVAE